MATDARTLFRDGNLDGAIEAATNVVRDNPNDAEARALLADFQCFAGAFDKADRQLDIIGTQNTKLAVAVAQTRQVIRGPSRRPPDARWRRGSPGESAPRRRPAWCAACR